MRKNKRKKTAKGAGKEQGVAAREVKQKREARKWKKNWVKEVSRSNWKEKQGTVLYVEKVSKYLNLS